MVQRDCAITWIRSAMTDAKHVGMGIRLTLENIRWDYVLPGLFPILSPAPLGFGGRRC